MPTCSICLEELDVCRDMCIRTVCRHDYHATCLQQWFMIRKDCPSCRHGLSRNDCKMVYLTGGGQPFASASVIPRLDLNGIQFRLSNRSDIYLCILFLFYLQHQMVLRLDTLPRRTSSMLKDCAFEIAYHLSSPPNDQNDDASPSSHIRYPAFYGRKELSIQPGRANESQPFCIAIDDFRTMFTNMQTIGTLPFFQSVQPTNGKDGGNLDEWIGR